MACMRLVGNKECICSMASRHRLTPAERQEIVRERCKGVTHKALAERFRVSERTIYYTLRTEKDRQRDTRIRTKQVSVTLTPEELQVIPVETSSVDGRSVPIRWRIELAALGRQLTVDALHPDQWMDVDFAYWEGYVLATGKSPGERGRGYLEMVGYR